MAGWRAFLAHGRSMGSQIKNFLKIILIGVTIPLDIDVRSDWRDCFEILSSCYAREDTADHSPLYEKNGRIWR